MLELTLSPPPGLQNPAMGCGQGPTCTEHTLHGAPEEQDAHTLVLPQLGHSILQLWRTPVRHHSVQPSPSPDPPMPHSYLTHKDVAQGIAGPRSVHQNLCDSCRGDIGWGEGAGTAHPRPDRGLEARGLETLAWSSVTWSHYTPGPVFPTVKWREKPFLLEELVKYGAK